MGDPEIDLAIQVKVQVSTQQRQVCSLKPLKTKGGSSQNAEAVLEPKNCQRWNVMGVAETSHSRFTMMDFSTVNWQSKNRTVSVERMNPPLYVPQPIW